jgi:hypothetical protein
MGFFFCPANLYSRNNRYSSSTLITKGRWTLGVKGTPVYCWTCASPNSQDNLSFNSLHKIHVWLARCKKQCVVIRWFNWKRLLCNVPNNIIYFYDVGTLDVIASYMRYTFVYCQSSCREASTPCKKGLECVLVLSKGSRFAISRWR